MTERTIGALARAAGVHVESIRFYQREGLVHQPPRAGSGWRRYGDDALHRIRFIKRAQALGFSLADVRQLLALQNNKIDRCGEVRNSAESKISEIDQKITDLRSMRCALTTLVERCHDRDDVLTCPIVEALAAPDRDLLPR